MKKVLIENDNIPLYLTVAKYSNNNRLYLGLENSDEDYFDDISINLTDCAIPNENYIYLNSDLPEELMRKLIDKKIISEIITTQNYNLGNYGLVSVNLDTIKEYDSEGYNKDFLSKNEDYEL